MAIIQDIFNVMPSWKDHLSESGYLKAPGQKDYHQKAGYNFKENFPNTPEYVADALGKAYQYGSEGIGSFFSDSTFSDAMARAKEESRLNSLGFRGQGFNMDEYNQTMDFARKGFDPNTGLTYGSAQAADLPTNSLERDFPGMSTGDIIDSMNNRQAANRYSGMGQVGPNKSDMIGNTIAEAMIDEDRIPGRVQKSVPNYQNWFERMMSGAQDKLGGAWGKTKELGSRFKEKAGPVFGLASMFANATNPLNPKSFNYNPNLKGQLDFMDKEMGGWSTNNPGTGLMQYGADTPLAGQNVMSVFGSNDPIAQLEKTLARRQKTWENYDNQWSNLKEKDIDAFNIQKKNWENKFFSEKQKGWLDDVKADQKARIDKKNKALAIKEAQKEARKKQQQYSGPQTYNYNPNIQTTGPTYGPHKGGGGKGSMPTGTAGRNPWGRRDGGRVGYGNGGLATLFTRRG